MEDVSPNFISTFSHSFHVSTRNLRYAQAGIDTFADACYNNSMAYGIKSFAKKVTLELIYEAMDEKFKGIDSRFNHVEEDMSKLETRLSGEISELKADVRSMNSRLDQMFSLLTQIIQQRNGK